MRYDAEADRIDMLVIYRGVFYESGSSGGGDGDQMKKAFEDYDKVLARGQAFFWNNWPLMVDVVKPAKATAALAEHVYVENGGLFTNPTGRLDGYQFVRIRDAKAFLGKLNTMLELAAQGALLTGLRGHKFDADTREFVREFLRDKQQMVRIGRGHIELRLPVSHRDFGYLLSQLESRFLDNAPAEMVRRVAVEKRREQAPDDASTTTGNVEVLLAEQDLRAGMKQAPSFRFFWDNQFTIARSEELQTVAIGAPDNRELRVVKASSGYYTDNFLRALRERGDELEEGVPDQEIMRRFEDFLTRDAVLPPELAALRNK